MRRILFILLTPILFLAIALTALNLYIIPKALEFAQTELTKYSEKNLPVTIRTGHIELIYSKPAIQISDIEIETKNDLAKSIRRIQIQGIEAQIDRFGLLTGSLGFSSIKLIQPEMLIELDPLFEKDTKPEVIPVEEIFSTLEKIPIQNIDLEKTQMKFISSKNNLHLQLKESNLSIANRLNLLTIRIAINNLSANKEEFGLSDIKIKSLVKIDKKNIDIEQFNVLAKGATIKANGSLLEWKNIAIHPKAKIEIENNTQFNELIPDIQASIKNKKIPDLIGESSLGCLLQIDGYDHISGNYNLQIKDAQISEYKLGNLKTSGHFNQKHLQLKEFEIQHPSGIVNLKNSELNFASEVAFHTDVDVKKLELQKLFQSLSLKNIPVDVLIAGQLNCKGEVKQFAVNCTGSVSGKDLLVKSENKEKASTIVNVENLEAKGSVNINKESVEYNTKLKLLDSIGESEGKIKFSEGFHISFKSPSVDFKNIKNLSNLKFEGKTSLNGFTEGDSDSAILQMDLGSHQFIFEDYQLGDMNTLLKYEKGHLILSNINAKMPQSIYNGDLDINLDQSSISGKLQFSKSDLNDITTLFERIYKFPLNLTGSGTAEARFDGPLNFWRLNYKLTSTFRNGSIHGDAFDELKFNVSADNGNIHTDEVSLKKNSSLITLRGEINNKQELNLKADTSNVRLEESEFINRIKNGISGTIQLRSELTGTVQAPELHVQGNLTDIVVDEQEIASSHFNLRTNNKKIELGANLFGNKIQGDLIMPMQKYSSPLILKLKTIDWNFTSLLALIGASSLQKEYESSISSDIDLHSEKGDFENLSGKIIARNIFLQRDYLSLQNTDPIQINIENGYIDFKSFKLLGPQNSVEFRSDKFRLTNLNIGIVADTELKLLHMFAPFLEDLGGPLKLSATITGHYLKPQILGNANIENAFVKIKGFPHPIEKLKSDIVFSHSRILIQNLKGQLGGGDFAGDGTVNINGLGDIPTNIRAHATGLNLVVPEKVQTSGTADLLFSGSWFPFVLSGNYYVASGNIEKEFGDDSAVVSDVRQSIYLPKILKQANFDPVLLDLQVHLDQGVKIKNSIIEGSLSGNIQVKGPPQSPILLGKINITKSSKLNFRDKKFEVISGFANFTNPNEINPELYISAQSRISPYDINLIVQGLSKNPNIRMSSVPSLPEQEIVSLLALGVTSSKLEESGQSKDQATQLAFEQLGNAAVGNGLSKGISNTVGVDLKVKVGSAYDPTKNTSTPKISFTSQLTDRISVDGNYLSQTNGDVKVNYLLDQNFSVIGSYEVRESQSNSTLTGTQNDKKSIFGLDIEFKKEFRW